MHRKIKHSHFSAVESTIPQVTLVQECACGKCCEYTIKASHADRYVEITDLQTQVGFSSKHQFGCSHGYIRIKNDAVLTL